MFVFNGLADVDGLVSALKSESVVNGTEVAAVHVEMESVVVVGSGVVVVPGVFEDVVVVVDVTLEVDVGDVVVSWHIGWLTLAFGNGIEGMTTSDNGSGKYGYTDSVHLLPMTTSLLLGFCCVTQSGKA